MAEITVEWEQIQRRRARLSVPDDATPDQITKLADELAHSGRAGHIDEILGTAVGHMSWQATDGRFGGRVR